MKLYCTAEASLDELFVIRKEEEEVFDEAFAFDRTRSRLVEMQSDYYFEKEHKFYKNADEEKMEDNLNEEK